jgi:hypothetical protein
MCQCCRGQSGRRYQPEFPELHALVRTTALIIEGTTWIPALVAAMTNGDWAAVPVDLRRSGSLDGTIRPTMKIDYTRVSELGLSMICDECRSP